MPIHEYKCPECGHMLMELTPLTPERHPTCALCGTRMDRLISVPSFRVTGFNAKNGYSSSKS